jgi:hypothetical protein
MMVLRLCGYAESHAQGYSTGSGRGNGCQDVACERIPSALMVRANLRKRRSHSRVCVACCSARRAFGRVLSSEPGLARCQRRLGRFLGREGSGPLGVLSGLLCQWPPEPRGPGTRASSRSTCSATAAAALVIRSRSDGLGACACCRAPDSAELRIGHRRDQVPSGPRTHRDGQAQMTKGRRRPWRWSARNGQENEILFLAGAWSRRHALPPWAACGRSLARLDLRKVPLLPQRPREPLRHRPLHGLHDRWRLRRGDTGR